MIVEKPIRKSDPSIVKLPKGYMNALRDQFPSLKVIWKIQTHDDLTVIIKPLPEKMKKT